MALQGTLDTFSLPDVLRLLATTTKTGRLRLEGDRGQGSVWLRDGRVVDADADRAVEGAPTDEVLFELLRFGRGSFVFDSETDPPDAEHPDEVDDVLRRANGLLSEWTELEAVVPSLDHRVSLSSELSSDDVTIDADRWRSVVAVGGGRSVGELARTLGLGELHVSRAVRDLVELGVADVEDPGPRSEPSRVSDRAALPDFGDLPGELSRRPDAPRSRPATPPRGVPRLPGEAPGGGGRSGERVPSPNGPEPALTGETPRAGWRQPEHTSGSHPAVGSEGLPPSARAGKGQRRVSGGAPTGRRPSPDTPPPSSAAPGPAAASRPAGPEFRPSASSNGGQPAPKAGRRRSASPPSPPSRGDEGASNNGPLPPPAPAAEHHGSDPRSASVFRTGSNGAPGGNGDDDDPSPFATGELIPPRGPIHTGQIRGVASSALPPEMLWAADDDLPGGQGTPGGLGGPGGPLTSPFAGLTSLGPTPPVPGDGELAPHLAAMSLDARAAVQATLGPTGGSTGARARTGDDVAQRGRLINFLSSVR